MNDLGLLAILIVAAVGVVAFSFYFLITKLLYVATPNEVLIFCGSTRQVGNKQVGYRFVRGGRSIRVPFLERVEPRLHNMFPVIVNV
jgi:flotillin